MARYDDPEPEGGDPPCWAHLFAEDLFGQPGEGEAEHSLITGQTGQGSQVEPPPPTASVSGPEPATGADGAPR